MTIDPRIRPRRLLIRGVAPLLLLVSACTSRGAPVKASEPATLRRDGPQSVERATEGDLLIEHVRVFDPARGSFTAPTDVLIRGDRIETIGNSAGSRSGVTRIDATGKYAVPGLWDSHVHLSFLTHFGDSALRATLQGFARKGITSVRDVGGPLDTIAPLSNRVALGQLEGPRIYYTGPMLSRAPLPPFLEGRNHMLPGIAVPVASSADVDSILDRLVGQGATMTKVFDPWESALLRYYASAAKKRSLRVVVDVGAPIVNQVPLDTLLAVGVSSIEHSHALWSAVLRDDLKREIEAFKNSGATAQARQEFVQRIMGLGNESVAPERLAALVDKWARSDTYFCPTLSVVELLYAGDTAERARRAAAGLRAVGGRFARELSVRGVKLLVGQDYIDPERTFKEMEYLARAGVRPVEILRGATLYPAQFLGMEDRLGTLDRAKTADILILDADPLERIENVRSTWRVIYKGKVLSREGT